MKVKGFLLPIVLLFLLILSGMNLLALQTLKQNYHLQALLLRNQDKLSLATHMMRKLEQAPLDACFLPKKCELNGISYYYENLSIDPCARLGTKAAAYYRLSIESKPKDRQDRDVFLQSTFVIAVKSQKQCVEKHAIQAGEQSFIER